MLKLGIAGCTGRMGLALVRAGGAQVVAAAERPGVDRSKAQAALATVGAQELRLVESAEALVAAADAVIEFTAPDNSVELARAVAKAGKVLVTGTTGLSPEQQAFIVEVAKTARIVQSANFSPGVNVLEALVERAAAMLAAYDIEVDEMHHALKKDAPSGTALMLGAAAARGRGVDFAKVKNHYAEGMIGERTPGSIGFSARRGGEVVGVHTVTLAGPGENLELTHRAFSRDIYAHGAIKAALWAAKQKPGLYSMRDVLGIN